MIILLFSQQTTRLLKHFANIKKIPELADYCEQKETVRMKKDRE